MVDAGRRGDGTRELGDAGGDGPVEDGHDEELVQHPGGPPLKMATRMEPPMAGQTLPTTSPTPASETRLKLRASSRTWPEALIRSEWPSLAAIDDLAVRMFFGIVDGIAMAVRISGLCLACVGHLCSLSPQVGRIQCSCGEMQKRRKGWECRVAAGYTYVFPWPAIGVLAVGTMVSTYKFQISKP